MIKKTLFIILAVMVITVSGCSNGTAQTTTESAAPVSDVMDYEMYIEDLDYYMNQYFQSYDSAKEAFGIQDADSTKEHLGNSIDALNSLRNIIYPPNLEEIHSELLSAAELQKKVIECDIELTSYTGASSELSDEERNSLNALNAKAAEILAEIEEKGSVLDAWRDAKNAAFSYIPNGEYRAYASTLEALCNDYITEINKLYGVIFDGTGGNALLICENLTETFSEIENMEIPEQLKPYHDEIIGAISVERECCNTVESLVALGSGYQGVAFEDLPADVQAQMNECMEKIESFFDEENEDFDALYNAIVSALEFAESKAGI